jgi:hypothetical protein
VTVRLRVLLAVAALAMGAAATAPAAFAASSLETGIADDAAVLQSPDPAAAAAQTVAQWRDIGIDNGPITSTPARSRPGLSAAGASR